MTWMHWILFSFLSLIALSVAFDHKAKPGTKFAAFCVAVALVLLLVLGQPK